MTAIDQRPSALAVELFTVKLGPVWRITTSPAMPPPQRYPILMHLGRRFENGRLRSLMV